MTRLRRAMARADVRTQTFAVSIGPPLLATVVLLAVVAMVAKQSLRFTDGVFVYALDDAYIHMAISKNLAAHGVWGATPHEFTASSSSPLWTLLLSGAFLAVGGGASLAPFCLAVASSVLLLWLSDHTLNRFGVGVLGRAAALLGIVFLTPLTPVVFGGMEHPLQMAIDVGLVSACAFIAVRDTDTVDSLTVTAACLALLAAAVRYEGLLLVVVACVVLLLLRRWRSALIIGAASLVPPLGFGLYSMSQGGFFLPNPVLIKTSVAAGIGALGGETASYLRLVITKLQASAPLILMAAAGVLLLSYHARRGAPDSRAPLVFALVSVVATVAHLLLGDVGWLFRYEAYLFVLMVLSLVALLPALRSCSERLATRRSLSLALALVLLAIATPSMLKRAHAGIETTPPAIKNVYEQPYQMAHFLSDNPQFDVVALNDLGAVAYFNDDIRIVDLAGLGQHRPPLELLGRPHPDTAAVWRNWTGPAPAIGMVFADWMAVPSEWTVVGTWAITDDVQVVGHTLTFCAIPPTDPETLRAALEDYSKSSLPDSVLVNWNE